MGMFDSVYFAGKAPNGFQLGYKEELPVGQAINDNALYQTKNLDCNLDVYVVDKDNRLIKYAFADKTNTPAATDYTGTLTIYTGIDNDFFGKPNPYILFGVDEKIRWIEFNLNFENGVLISVTDL